MSDATIPEAEVVAAEAETSPVVTPEEAAAAVTPEPPTPDVTPTAEIDGSVAIETPATEAGTDQVGEPVDPEAPLDGEAPTEIAVRETAKVDPAVDSEKPSGFDHGEVVTSIEGLFERIVHDFDEAGAVIGWHKEEAPDPDAPIDVESKPAEEPSA